MLGNLIILLLAAIVLMSGCDGTTKNSKHNHYERKFQ
jgi:hypothetical protein